MSRARVTIAPLTLDHLPACARMVQGTALLTDYGLDAARATRLLTRALQDADPCLVLAMVDGDPAGFAWIEPQGGFGRSPYLRLIVVHPARTGQGVGQQLMQHLERRFLQPSGLLLLCADHNQAAQRFYQRLGYQQVGLLPDYVKPGLDERIYFKGPGVNAERGARSSE